MNPNYYDYGINISTTAAAAEAQAESGSPSSVIWFCPYKFISMQQFQQFMAVASKFIRSAFAYTDDQQDDDE